MRRTSSRSCPASRSRRFTGSKQRKAKEGQMARKNLNDVIHGDRAVVRANHYSNGNGSVLDDWEAWEANRKGKGKSSKYDDDDAYYSGSSKKSSHYTPCY